MATTSGVYTFTVNRDTIIQAALRLTGKLSEGASPTTYDVTNCSEALNILIKAMMADGLTLWTMNDVSVPMVANQRDYTIGAVGNVIIPYVPLKVLQAILRDSNNRDISLMQISRNEYENYSDKTTETVPNQYYYNPGLTLGTLSMLPPPVDSTHTVILTVQRQLMDMTAATDLFDFPQEWYQALKWNLADELSLEYDVPTDKMQLIAVKAMAYRKALGDWSQEEATTFFTPDHRGGRRG